MLLNCTKLEWANSYFDIWASAWNFQQCGMCDQQSLWSACAYAQSDQSLCLGLEYSMIVKLLTEHHFEFLSLTGGCRGSAESTLVKMSNCWKSHAAPHLYVSEKNRAELEQIPRVRKVILSWPLMRQSQQKSSAFLICWNV